MSKTYPRKTPRIRCVLIGDGGVGKSSFLITVATDVFPADYVPIVFDNSVTDVQLLDGREAEVAFWDTVGAKEYDRVRTFTYPETDVLLACFAVDSYSSFENIKSKWISEITHYCPDTPWLLVGMKSDLRSNDGEARPARSMVEKDEAVQLAKDLRGVGYYECSSLLCTGLDDIVQAAVSTGLNYHSIKQRRRKSTHSSKMKKPLVPFPSEPPAIVVPSSTLQSEWEKMINNKHLSDVQFHYKTDCYHGHKVVLCAASELFRQIFEIGRGLEAEESLSQCNRWSKKRLKSINRQCINSGAIGAFKNIYDKDNISVITVNDDQVSKLAFEKCLAFLYTGCANVKNDDDIEDIIAAAELLNLPELIVECNNVKSDEEFLHSGLEKRLNDRNSEVMRKLFFNNTLYSDITLVVDGQKIPAHRCVLTTRCEVMSAMFSGQFAESNTAEVEIPGVSLKTLMAFLEYLYTDHCSMDEEDVMAILILANQYCVNRLKALCELHISKMVEEATKENALVTDFSVIDLLLTAQIHNGDQLSGFLLHFVANHFQAFEKTEEFQKLTGGNLSYVKEHRWPPLSYIDAMEEWKEKNSTNKKNCIVM